MAYKKSKKEPFDKACVMEALHLRNSNIRKLDDAYGFGWSSKSVERGLKSREVPPDLLDALGKYLNVDPDYLSGKYHRECEKIKDEKIRDIWKSCLCAEKHPYIIKQQKTKIDGDFLYEKYLEYILIIHDISMEQFNIMSFEQKKELQIAMEEAISPVLIKYFPMNAIGQKTWPGIYKLQNEIEEYNPNEPELP